jgi:hypothetical protein
MFSFKVGKYIQGRAWPPAALSLSLSHAGSRLLNKKNKNNNNNAAAAFLGAVKGPATPFTISRLAGPAHPLGLVAPGRAREPARGRIASQFPQLTYSLHCPLNSLTNNLTSSATTSLTNEHTNTGHQTQNPSLAAGVGCLCVFAVEDSNWVEAE